jgi:hypothetical protein
MTGNFFAMMTADGWAIFSVIAAVFSAGFYLVNQYLRQPGHLLTFWMRLMIVLGMAPMMMHLVLPRDPAFYGLVFLSVLTGTFADIRTMNASATFGGGVVSRVMPLSVWGAFFLWLPVHPETFTLYLAHPLNTLGITIALGLCVFFAMRMNRSPVSKSAFMTMLPALLGYAAANVINKQAMHYGLATQHLAGAVYGYMFVQSAIAVPLVGVYCLWQHKKQPPLLQNARPLIVAALLLALFWFCHMIYKNYAMAFTPNPAYMAALGLLSPVFISAFYFLTGHREKTDVASGFGIVFSALLLAALTLR